MIFTLKKATESVVDGTKCWLLEFALDNKPSIKQNRDYKAGILQLLMWERQKDIYIIERQYDIVVNPSLKVKLKEVKNTPKIGE